MAPELLPDSEDPLLDQVARGPAEDLITAMVAGLVALYADNGRWLRALDAAAAADPAVASELDRALVGPRQLLEQIVANAPHPPADPREFALLLMATHRAYLLDTFGRGDDSPERRANATAAPCSALAPRCKLAAGLRSGHHLREAAHSAGRNSRDGGKIKQIHAASDPTDLP